MSFPSPLSCFQYTSGGITPHRNATGTVPANLIIRWYISGPFMLTSSEGSTVKETSFRFRRDRFSLNVSAWNRESAR